MSIPTRDELIARASQALAELPGRLSYLASGVATVTVEWPRLHACLVSEIRRAVAEELEALLRYPPGGMQERHAQARLAALRAEQTEQPPGAATAPGATERSKVVGESRAPGRAGNAQDDLPGPGSCSTDKQGMVQQASTGDCGSPDAGSTPAPLTTSERAEGRAASSLGPSGSVAPAPEVRGSPCPPPAVSMEQVRAEYVARFGDCCHGADPMCFGQVGCLLQRTIARNEIKPERHAAAAPPPSSAESDARALERAAEIVRAMVGEDADGPHPSVDTLTRLSRQLRAAAPEPEVDVFRAFERAYDGQGDERLHELARDWLGSTVAYVKTMAARPCVQPGKDCGWCDSCEARLSMAALRRRATEARS